MKKFATLLAAFFCCAVFVCGAAELQWERDFAKAKKDATAQKKPILAVFAGSDWCPPCIKLEENILSKKAFQRKAEEKVVLFFADFPRRKSLPNAEKKQNGVLARTYKISGFPTVLLLNADGKEFARNVGAPAYDIAGFLRWLDQNVPKVK